MEEKESDLLMRVAQIGMVINALMATIATLGFVGGFVPHAEESPILARRVAAGEFAGALIMLIVSRRLRREPSLIVLPLVFVFWQVVCSAYDISVTGKKDELPPLMVETVFFVIYAAFFTKYPGARVATR